MGKRPILKLLSSVLFWIASLALAVNAADLLPPDQAFRLTSSVRKADTVLLSWDIASGYYLYRHRFKFVSRTPGIETGVPVFPVGHAKHDEFFVDVEIFRAILRLKCL